VPGSTSTADGTGAAMQAMPDTEAAQRGLNYLHSAQHKGGGFPLGGNGGVNSQSTAWAIQGILAVGGNPESYRRGGADPFDYLAARQAGDGHYAYSDSSDQTPIWVTGEALVAAAHKSLPLDPPAREPKPPAPQPQPAPTSPPPAAAPATPLEIFPPATEATPPVEPGGSNPGDGSGAPGERFVPPGSTAPEAPAEVSPPAGRVSQGSGTVTQTGTLASSNFDPPHQSPTIPLLIGLGLTAAVLAGTRWLARRNDW
jgi:hypothetical protein